MTVPMIEEQADAIILELLKKYDASITVDINTFFDLLKHSLSLNTVEKKRVVDAVPTLSQLQFDKLTEVFEDERVKFRDLAKEHPEDIKKLLDKQQKEWLQLGDIYTAEAAKKEQENEEQGKIDDIKSSLGL